MRENHCEYLSGFPNYHTTEALAGTLPERGNSPQKPNFGLYAEQLSGSSFTASRDHNLRSWLYRIKPTAGHSPFVEINSELSTSLSKLSSPSPQQYRWNPIDADSSSSNFIESLRCIVSNRGGQYGAHVFLYNFRQNSPDDFLVSADGEWMIVPYQGTLEILTEFGRLNIEPLEIAVVPRGIKFQVNSSKASSRCAGYILENWGSPFRLPELGPIGSNGLANPRDFLVPTAHFIDEPNAKNLYWKYQDRLFHTQTQGHPLDVVGWHGNYFPYKYDLRMFNVIGTVSFDHPDPSIFTVLTSASERPGFANIDFAIFPPRWMVAEETFRPPYYHRNLMSEYMGMICGIYDAKETGFTPGGSSLHNCMSGHGPDAEAFIKASESELRPTKLDNTMAFMWESRFAFRPTEWAMTKPGFLQPNYTDCWKRLPRNFKK